MKKYIHSAAGFFITFIFILNASLPVSAAVLSYDREELPGGAVLLVKESRQLPMVTIRVSLRAGTRYESPDKAGLADMTARMLLRGTIRRNASDIEKLNDLLGGGVGVSAGRDFAAASLRVLSRDLEKGFSLLAEVLRKPVFPADEFKKMRRRILGQLQRKKDRPGYLANRAFRKRIFGSHPYGRQVSGTAQTLKKIRHTDLAKFHRERYEMKGAIFVFVGDITLTRAREMVLGHFKGWKATGGALPKTSPAPKIGKMSVIKIDHPFKQTTVLLGNVSITRKHKDFYAARVMNYILGGGGFDSRITSNIREEKGLVYAAYSYFAAGVDTGHWRLMLQTKNKSANEAISESIKEIRRMQEKGVTDQELAEAKAYITGNFATRFESSSRIAGYILAVERLGFPPDYAGRYLDLIRAVTKEQIQASAQKHIRLDKSVLTVVGNMSEAKLKY